MLYYAYRWLRFRERYCDANKITFNFGVECAKCVRTTTKDDPVKALATYQKSWYHIGVLWDICGYEAMKEVYETYITECKENNAKNDKEKPKHALDVLKRLCYRALSGTHLKRFEALQAKHFKVKAK